MYIDRYGTYRQIGNCRVRRYTSQSIAFLLRFHATCTCVRCVYLILHNTATWLARPLDCSNSQTLTWGLLAGCCDWNCAVCVCVCDIVIKKRTKAATYDKCNQSRDATEELVAGRVGRGVEVENWDFELQLQCTISNTDGLQCTCTNICICCILLDIYHLADSACLPRAPFSLDQFLQPHVIRIRGKHVGRLDKRKKKLQSIASSQADMQNT